MDTRDQGLAAELERLRQRLEELEEAERRWRGTEEVLRQSRRMLQLVLDTIPVRVFWKDRNSAYLGCNRLFALDAGLGSPEDLLGRTDTEMGWRDQAQLYRADDRQVMESGEAKVGYEEPQTTPTGDRIWLRTSKVPLRDGQDRVVGVLGTYEDITEQREAQEQRRLLEAQLLHAQKLESLGVLAGGIAHDFNNLLVAVLGNAELALTTLPPDSPAVPYLRDIDAASRRAAELCRQMLAYSGRGRFVVETLDLNREVGDMTQILEVAVSRRVTIRYHLVPELPAVEADSTQLRQVLMNLITNASEACEEQGGVIDVSTGVIDLEAGAAAADPEWGLSEGRYVWLEVEDSGTGMTPEVREKLFEPFFSTKFTGRGLGMSVVLGIMRGHHGAIELDSESGRGTRVRVLLPASDKVPNLCDVTSRAEELPRGGTVLVVDDDDAVRSVAQSMLTRLGVEVIAAADGAEGIRLFRAHSDEIIGVLLDLTMPGVGGEEVLRELRQLDPDVRVVLSSGYNEVEVIERLAGRGPVGFIQKPYHLADLKRALIEVLQ